MNPMDDSLDEVMKVLLHDIEPEVPPPDVAARIKRSVLGRVGVDMIDVRRDEGWQPLSDKAEMKVLNDDGTTLSWLARLLPGAVLKGHDHHGVEECLVLEGDLWLNDVRFGPGDYQLALPGSRHDHARSEGGCLAFVRSPSPQARRERVQV